MVSGFSVGVGVGVGVGVAVAVGVTVGATVAVGMAVLVRVGGAGAVDCATFATGVGGLLHAVATANRKATSPRWMSFMVISSR
jgi:hypothetical protein